MGPDGVGVTGEKRAGRESSKRAEGGRRNRGKSRCNVKIFCNRKKLKIGR